MKLTKLDTSYYAYEIEFSNGLVVTLRRAGCLWESECCGIMDQHLNEQTAVAWAFELSKWAISSN